MKSEERKAVLKAVDDAIESGTFNLLAVERVKPYYKYLKQPELHREVELL